MVITWCIRHESRSPAAMAIYGSGGGSSTAVIERNDRHALMAGGQRISGMDVGIAGGAEGGGIGFAGENGGGELADFADPEALMAGGELVGGVDLHIAGHAEEGGVGPAEDQGLAMASGITRFGHGGQSFGHRHIQIQGSTKCGHGLYICV